MNRYLSKMCQLREHEIEAERMMRMDRRRDVVEAVVLVPVMIGLLVLLMFA